MEAHYYPKKRAAPRAALFTASSTERLPRGGSYPFTQLFGSPEYNRLTILRIELTKAIVFLRNDDEKSGGSIATVE